MSKSRARPGRRAGNESRGANSNQHRQSTSASAGSRDGSNANQNNRRSGKGASNLSKSTDNVQNGSSTTPTTVPPPDDHVPVVGFNAAAVEATLKKGYETKATLYKPDAASKPSTTQSPWDVKGSMANGKDFWLDLRRQIWGLQQTGGVSQGG